MDLPHHHRQVTERRGLPLYFLKGQTMKNAAREFIESVFGFAVFTVITLAIASTTYQIINPDGGLLVWLGRLWDSNPTLLVMLGGVTLLVKRWLSGVQGAQAADIMFYAAVLLGLYYGFNLLIAV
jgi:hypothetical protein